MLSRISFVLLLSLCHSCISVQAQNTYKITLLRAAPAKLLELIDVLKEKRAEYVKSGGHQVYIVRHSQGDQWDFMIYEYIDTYKSYFSENSVLNKFYTPPFGDKYYNLIGHHETIYVDGPSVDIVDAMFGNMNYFHVEMFNALPGKQNELLKQRKMENVYLDEIGRDPNLIFTVLQGANWDCFTLGGYRDIKHYAESSDIPIEVEEKAAIKAGFKGVNHISPYLRSLIVTHHDTLGGQL